MILTALTSSLLVFGILFSVGTLQKSDAASVDYYLEIEGVKGESHITNCPDCMKISSWNWGTINSEDIGDVISQLEVQGQIPKEFNFTKVTSSASPKLFEAALVGNHFKTGKLLGFEKTPPGDAAFKITFSDIFISGYQIAQSQLDDSSMDQIIINFSNAKVELPSQASTTTGETSEYQIPSWIKNNAGWWSEGQIDDSDFVKGMEYLIEQGIMKVPKGQSENIQSDKIPSWVKNNAKWWSEGQIDDSDFVKGIQWLISNGLIKVKFPSLPG